MCKSSDERQMNMVRDKGFSLFFFSFFLRMAEISQTRTISHYNNY